MTSTLAIGINSYYTEAQIDAYLGDSLVASTAWSAVDDDAKAQASIEAFRRFSTLRWMGAQAGDQIVTAIAVANGGANYAIDDLLTVVGGTFGEAAVARVLTLSGSAVATVEILDVGTYDPTLAVPTNPVATTTNGSGTGATLNLTFGKQTADFPRIGLTDQYGNPISSTTTPVGIIRGQMEFAFALSQNPSLVSVASTGTNISQVQAGPAGVHFFRPGYAADGTPGVPFPIPVWNYIKWFLVGGVARAGIASGTTGHSEFERYPREYDLFQGY